MGNETNCVALNRNGVKGRNVLALTDESQITKYQIYCTAEVYIESARFEAPYVGPYSLPRPQLQIEGSVSKVKLEDPNITFPCGTNSMSFMPNESEHVSIAYRLSDAEISSLAAKGLFCNFEDRGYGYMPPANMVGNTMDIPMNIVYYGIQNEPVALVEVIRPDDIPTETRLNTYYGIFDIAPYEEKVVHELEGKLYPYGLGEPIVSLPEADFIIKQREEAERLENERINDQMNGVQPVEDQIQIVEEEDDKFFGTPVNHEDKDITDKINSVISSAASRDEAIHENKAGFDARGVVNAVNAEHAAQAAQRELELEHQHGLSYESSVDNTNSKAKPNTIADKMELLYKMTTGQDDNSDAQLDNKDNEGLYDILSQSQGDGSADKDVGSVGHANAQVEESHENVRRVDRALDNQALNAGVTDISGFGAGEASADNKPDDSDANQKSDGTGLEDVNSILSGILPDLGVDTTANNATSAESRNKQTKTNVDRINRIDRALDNQALNEGITDIAGHGAVSKPESDRSRDADNLAAGLKSDNGSSGPGQRFL